MAGLVVLDASALIALLSELDPHHPWALEMFRETAYSQLAMTALTFAEVQVHPIKANKLEALIANIASLGIEILPIAESDAYELARLRVETRLKMPDAVVLQACIKLSAGLATTDQELSDAAKNRNLQIFSPAS